MKLLSLSKGAEILGRYTDQFEMQVDNKCFDNGTPCHTQSCYLCVILEYLVSIEDKNSLTELGWKFEDDEYCWVFRNF